MLLSYGDHCNAYLLENYGFILDDNPFDSWQFRLNSGNNPEQEIESPDELIPSKKTLDEKKTVNMTTTTFKLQSYHLNTEFMSYLRSQL